MALFTWHRGVNLVAKGDDAGAVVLFEKCEKYLVDRHRAICLAQTGDSYLRLGAKYKASNAYQSALRVVGAADTEEALFLYVRCYCEYYLRLIAIEEGDETARAPLDLLHEARSLSVSDRMRQLLPMPTPKAR